MSQEIAEALQRIAHVEEMMLSLQQKTFDVLRELKEERSQQAQEERLSLPIKQAYQILGYSTAEQLRGRIQSGYYRLGKEVEDRRKSGAKNARLYVNIGACRKRDQENPARRAT